MSFQFPDNVLQRVKELPTKPGVYLMKNRQGVVLYVGKAKDLRKRVQTYFRPSADLETHKQILVRQVEELDWVETASENDALVLEDNLIKEYQPRFNVLSKDDKGFLYIHITDDAFPRVMAVRRPDIRKAGMYYGPYPFARSLRDVLKLLHSIFPYRTCSTLPKKACLEYYIGNCTAPCISKTTEAEYRAMIAQVIDFFEGRSTDLKQQVEQAMEAAVEQQQFEQAARYRDQMKAINTLIKYQKTPRSYLEEYYQHTALDPQLGLRDIQQALNLPEVPKRIEVYDISHFQGQYSVGSMIVFTDGFPDKAEYRRFKIKTVHKNDDFASHAEVARRRANRTIKSGWPKPDLAIIDGGKGQLSATQDYWQHIGVAVVSLAKRHEEIFLPDQPEPILLPPGSQGLFLLQRMRDEAHRFAITYYRKLHSRSLRSHPSTHSSAK